MFIGKIPNFMTKYFQSLLRRPFMLFYLSPAFSFVFFFYCYNSFISSFNLLFFRYLLPFQLYLILFLNLSNSFFISFFLFIFNLSLIGLLFVFVTFFPFLYLLSLLFFRPLCTYVSFLLVLNVSLSFNVFPVVVQ